MQTRRLGPLGAEIVGFDFTNGPSRTAIETLRALVLQHHLLLFRGRTLDPARQCAFTRLFGGILQTCSPRNRFVPGFPEVARVANREGEGHLNIGPYWHSDGAYLAEPTAISVHHIIVPTEDGATLYTDLAAAYERLGSAERAALRRFATRAPTGVVHPLVKPHPVTGRLGLYVNLDGSAAVVDERGRPQPRLEAFLIAHLHRDDTYYRHVWREGDIIVADNFAVAHHATPADPARLRVLHRTAIHGPSVWWRGADSGTNGNGNLAIGV